MADRARGPSGRSAAVHRHRVDPRTCVVTRRRAHRTAPGRRRSGCPAGASRPISFAAHMGSRWRVRRPADRHPAPTQAHQPRHHLDLPRRASTAPRSSTPPRPPCPMVAVDATAPPLTPARCRSSSKAAATPSTTWIDRWAKDVDGAGRARVVGAARPAYARPVGLVDKGADR